ncbi:hypothetical protein DITRI_Ditri08aG0027600 [Diplodiscus trichospermus]
MQDIQALVNELVSKLQKRRIEGSDTTALLTVELLRLVISQEKMSSANKAGALIEAVGLKLIAANPVELAVGNIMRRVLHIIREEDLSLMKNALGGRGISTCTNGDQDLLTAAVAAQSLLHPPSLHSLLERLPDSGTASKTSHKNASLRLKNDVLEGVNYLIEDIKNCHEQIAEQAVELIHQNEVVLTFGRSLTEEFPACCNKEKPVISGFCCPGYEGHILAKELAARGVQTTLIADTAIVAVISRVNMIIVGVHAVMANGGIIGPVGSNKVALAAKRHAVPFVVVADCIDHGISSGAPPLHVANPAFDYVLPELVSLFITDMGGHNPSLIYRLISDHY